MKADAEAAHKTTAEAAAAAAATENLMFLISKKVNLILCLDQWITMSSCRLSRRRVNESTRPLSSTHFHDFPHQQTKTGRDDVTTHLVPTELSTLFNPPNSSSHPRKWMYYYIVVTWLPIDMNRMNRDCGGIACKAWVDRNALQLSQHSSLEAPGLCIQRSTSNLQGAWELIAAKIRGGRRQAIDWFRWFGRI